MDKNNNGHYSGQTDGNVKDLGHARTNDPLNSHGKLQAKLAGQRLKDETFDQVYSSTSDRAHQTATIMLQQNMTPHKEVILTNALMERHYGVLEGVPREQIRQAMRESGKGLLEVMQLYLYSTEDVLNRKYTRRCILTFLFSLIPKEERQSRKWMREFGDFFR